LEVIEQVVNLIQTGQIVEYRYNQKTQSIELR
jgi:hypothetical protein